MINEDDLSLLAQSFQLGRFSKENALLHTALLKRFLKAGEHRDLPAASLRGRSTWQK